MQNKLLINFILLLLCAGVVSAQTFPSDLHQYVIVKATKFVPQALQNQILKHREEILQGCLSVFQGGITPDAATIWAEYDSLLRLLKGRLNFARISFRLGRLSALINEYSSPLLGLPNNRLTNDFIFFISKTSRLFPIVGTTASQDLPSRKLLSRFLLDIDKRSKKRREGVRMALGREPDVAQWQNRFSLTYGNGSKLYNDMVNNTILIWLALWQDAGGYSLDAPYFGGR